MQKNSFILNWWIRHPLQMRMESHRLQMTSSHELTLMSYKEEVKQFSKNLLWSKTWYKLTLYIYRIWKFRAISEQGAHWAEKQTRSKNSWRVCLAWISTVWKQKKLLVSQLEKHLKHYKLSSSGTKADKIRKISLHVLGADKGGGKHADDKSVIKLQKYYKMYR